MTITRIILGLLFLLLSISILILWIFSFSGTSNFTLTDRIILYSHEGTLWYTRDDAGGLRKAGPIAHGQRITALLPRTQSALDFRYVRNPPLTLLIVPYWAMLILTVPLSFLFPLRVLKKKESYGKCPNCGYDVRATPRRCPECGTPIGRGGRRDN